MLLPALAELQKIEVKLAEFVKETECFFLELGHRVFACRVQAKKIKNLNNHSHEVVLSEKISEIHREFNSMEMKLCTRNESISMLLEQGGWRCESINQGINSVIEVCDELKNSMGKNAFDAIPPGQDKKICDQPLETINKLGIVRNRLLKLKRTSEAQRSLPYLRRKLEIQHRILQNKTSHAPSIIKQEHDSHAKNLAGQGRAIESHVDEIVSWLQFDDITRQKINHINLSLFELRNDISSRLERKEIDEKACDYLMAEVCELQKAHLDFVRSELKQALSELETRFHFIDGCLAECRKIIHNLNIYFPEYQNPSTGGFDFILQQIYDGLAFNGATFKDFDHCVKYIHNTLTQNLSIRESLARDIAKLRDQLQNLETFTSMPLKAPDARSDFVNICLNLVTGLERLLEYLDVVNSDLEMLAIDFSRLKDGAQSSVESLREKISAIKLKVSLLYDTLKNQKHIPEKTTELQNEIMNTISEIKGFQTRLDFIESVQTSLQSFVESGDRSNVDKLDGKSQDLIDRIYERYTMLNERLIHQKLSPIEEKQDDKSTESILGENVELF